MGKALILVDSDEIVKNAIDEIIKSKNELKSKVDELESQHEVIRKKSWATIDDRLFDLGLTQDKEQALQYKDDERIIVIEDKEELVKAKTEAMINKLRLALSL